MIRSLSFVFTVILVLLLQVAAFAEETYVLFKKEIAGDGEVSTPVESYHQIVRNLKAGDTVVFSNGERFVLQRYLGEGNTNRIFSIGNGKVIRIPCPHIDTGLTISKVVRYTLFGYEALKNQGVHIVKIFTEESLKNEYVIAEEVEILYNLQQWLRKAQHDKAIKDDFIKFAVSTAGFVQIADMHAEQIVYTREHGWILLDWLYPHVLLARYPKHGNIAFDGTPDNVEIAFRSYPLPLPFSLYKEVRKAIESKRKQLLPTDAAENRCWYKFW